VRRLTLLASLALPLIAAAGERPSVASINLCTDQLVLELADPAQILTLSWLASDPEESMLASEARRYPRNFGAAEELVGYAPDVVVAGTFTSGFTRRLLGELGFEVVAIEPAGSLDDIERNLRTVGAAIGRSERAETLIAHTRAHAARIAAARAPRVLGAVVVRPGGFTVGKNTLADEILALAGFANLPAQGGLDRWGSLSLETLLRSAPALLVLSDYRRSEASLANVYLEHPAIARLRRETHSVSIAAKYWACGLPDSLDSADLLQRAVAARPTIASTP
jgi:iron complex transport system substrate-binding protein